MQRVSIFMQVMCCAEGTRVTDLAVAVINTRYQLLEKKASLIFTEPASLDNPVKQLSTCCIFHDNAQMCWCKEHL